MNTTSVPPLRCWTIAEILSCRSSVLGLGTKKRSMVSKKLHSVGRKLSVPTLWLFPPPQGDALIMDPEQQAKDRQKRKPAPAIGQPRVQC